jgi:hypothetical protein
MQITKYFLDIYKFISYLFLFYFVGWFLEKYFLLDLIYFFITIFILALTQFFLLKKKFFLPFFLIFLLLGNCLAQNKNFILNIWLQSSLEQLKSHNIGFFLLKIKWNLEDKNINIFLNRDDIFIPSKHLSNFDSSEKLIFSIDYLPLFMVYHDENNQLKKIKISNHSSNAGIIYADDKYNFIFYDSQTGNSMKRIRYDDEQFKEIWHLKGKYFFHHWGDFYNNKVYLPGRKYEPVKKIKKFADTNISYYKNFINNLDNKACDNKYLNQDTILIIDYNTGKILEEINIFDIVLNSKFSNLFKDCINPIHLNDIEIIKKESQLEYFQNASLGDYLISLRNINTILLVDHKNKKIKWSYNDQLVMQHSPQITDRGTLLVFNNQGSKVIPGQSRIDEIDLKTKKIVGIFDGVKNNFYSEKRGRIQYLNGRILIQESTKSNLFELICNGSYISDDCKKKEVVKLNQVIKDVFQSYAIDFF